MQEIDAYLADALPDLPKEVRDFVTGVLISNAEDFRSASDIEDAVGFHFESDSCDLVRSICAHLMLLLHDGKDVLPEREDSSRKLAQSVSMQLADTNHASVETIWKLSTRDTPTMVDRRKLERAEERSREKADKRLGDASTDSSKRKTYEISATASQAASRREKDARDEKDDDATANALDIHLENVDIAFGTKQLLTNADLTLVYGRRYGLCGRNGLGKTTLLKMISSGQLVIPSGIRMLSVEQEVDGDDTTVIDSVLASDTQRQSLLEREAQINAILSGTEKDVSDEEREKLSEELNACYAKMESLQLDKAPAKAAAILFGLGFAHDEHRRPTREFSGGWRMRVALARALFVRPDLLLLDEPTNMLDMRAVYWLENHLQDWAATIVVVSHSRSFLNAICTDIIHLHSRRLDQYRGNYDNFIKTMTERLLQQQREYDAQMKLREHTQQFIDKFRYNAKRASMVQSRIKMLEKLPVMQPIEKEAGVMFRFPGCEALGNPVLQLDEVSFRYSPQTRWIFENLCIGTQSHSRVCIVGENGTGKTTLLRLLLGDSIGILPDDQVTPTKGVRNANRRLKIGYFTQHHVDQLDMDASAIEVAMKKVPDLKQEDYRAALGRFGLSGDLVFQSVQSLSGGQKSRLAFALLALTNPNYLILDEPTNHLDVETVEALGKSLQSFNGGVILVSHDERLIELVCKELWVVKDRTVINLDGGIKEYKKIIYKQLQLPGTTTTA